MILVGSTGLLLSLNIHKPAPVNAQAISAVQQTFVYNTAHKPASPQPAPKVLVPAAPQCGPDTGYTAAGPIGSAGTGLVEITDKTYAHKMYGHTAGQLYDLSMQCPLILPASDQDDVNAATSYWLGWRFNYAPTQGGLCTVSDAAVILHTSQSLPTWQNAGQNADPALTVAWQKYAAAVTAHENGHLQLDKDYANKILSQLQNFPPQDCGTLEQAINTMANGLVTALDQANANYDISTEYGARQGAIVP